MQPENKKTITIEAIVMAATEKVWSYWTDPKHIVNWNFASDDWHAPYAENDVRPDGRFKLTMAAKDGSMSFDFEGTFTSVQLHQSLAYVLADGRKVEVVFKPDGERTRVVETFDAENTNPVELQRAGWQAILHNFKKYVEAH